MGPGGEGDDSFKSPSVMKKFWVSMKELKRDVWQAKNAACQRKVNHLKKKAEDCSRHKKCRELDQLRMDRRKAWLDIVSTKHTEGNQSMEWQNRMLDELVRTGAEGISPGYRTTQEDLAGLEEEEKQVVTLSQLFNREYKVTRPAEGHGGGSGQAQHGGNQDHGHGAAMGLLGRKYRGRGVDAPPQTPGCPLSPEAPTVLMLSST